ncbi:39S ribosomal protein L44, mitochondrial [Frankliniella occidentalis]|uniref:Large ribosomal subunit protein mL44 n=1 Tax=Frankliniella occidentalis TaxID=133901 RepID=A0A6J1SUM0_FRAOC|nr:39S ribosomal protein L44, mitochondrial [Frankliniella occidentalis]
MATIRGCLAASVLFRNSVKKSCVKYQVVRTVYGRKQSDERADMIRELFKRKQEAGPEKKAHRGTYLDWNYKSELFAFSKRIGETFMNGSLERAFTQRSYVLQQEATQKDLGLDDPDRVLEDNRSLAEKGEELSRDFVARYLRTALPCLPEENIQSIRDHLLKPESVANIISNIGADELILTSEFPTEIQTRVSTFYALIGAIEESSGQERGALFVRDFIIASLSGQDINALIMPENKFETLREIFLREGKEPPEPRLISHVGINTIIPSYRVGIYSEKKHIGTGDGESVKDALDNASLSVLWKMWGVPDAVFQFPYQLDVGQVLSNNQTNVPGSEWTREKISCR